MSATIGEFFMKITIIKGQNHKRSRIIKTINGGCSWEEIRAVTESVNSGVK